MRRRMSKAYLLAERLRLSSSSLRPHKHELGMHVVFRHALLVPRVEHMPTLRATLKGCDLVVHGEHPPVLIAVVRARPGRARRQRGVAAGSWPWPPATHPLCCRNASTLSTRSPTWMIAAFNSSALTPSFSVQ